MILALMASFAVGALTGAWIAWQNAKPPPTTEWAGDDLMDEYERMKRGGM